VEVINTMRVLEGRWTSFCKEVGPRTRLIAAPPGPLEEPPLTVINQIYRGKSKREEKQLWLRKKDRKQPPRGSKLLRRGWLLKGKTRQRPPSRGSKIDAQSRMRGSIVPQS
jgi:hypothetical protein